MRGSPELLTLGDVRLELLEKRFPHRFCRASALSNMQSWFQFGISLAILFDNFLKSI